jgi:hypothetical protein
MGTLEKSLSTKEPSNDHDKLDNERQKNSSVSNEEENLSQEGAFNDISVVNKTSETEHVVEKKQSEQNNFTSETERLEDNSSVPFVENQFGHKDHESENNNGTSHLMEIELD